MCFHSTTLEPRWLRWSVYNHPRLVEVKLLYAVLVTVIVGGVVHEASAQVR